MRGDHSLAVRHLWDTHGTTVPRQSSTVATIEKRGGIKGDIRYRVRVRVQGEEKRTRTFKPRTGGELWAKKVTATDAPHSKS